MRCFGLVVLALLAGCKKEATQLLVVVDSDLHAGDEVAEVHADVIFELGSTPADQTNFRLGEVQFPFSFGVVPEEDGQEDVAIVLVPVGPNMQQLFAQRVVTKFVEEKTLIVPMVLLASCAELVDCNDPRTCRGGECGSDQYDPSSFEEVEPGDEFVGWMRPRPKGDAGMPTDSGVSNDSGVVDTGVPDSGMQMDAGMIDPSCTVESDCDQPNKCPMDAQQGCTCRNTPMGMNCIAVCSQANMTCPQPPTGETLRCDVNMGVCVPM